eukprot:3341339-Prymnesium_polylepis.1
MLVIAPAASDETAFTAPSATASGSIGQREAANAVESASQAANRASTTAAAALSELHRPRA